MWYPKKLFLLVKSLNFIVLISSASLAIAADKTIISDDIVVEKVVPRVLTVLPQIEYSTESLEESSVKLGFGKQKFLESQRKLIDGRQLTVQGIAVFSANDLVGAAIRTLTASSWSHVGLILEDELDNSLFCFESTGAASQILQGIAPQVQISSWQDVVADYDGRVAKRQFNFGEKKPKWQDVVKYVQGNLGKPYETNLESLIMAIRGDNKENDVSSVFCSEMVADCLITLGYLDSEKLSSNYVPGDFSSKRILSLINGASLGKEIMVKGKAEGSCCVIL